MMARLLFWPVLLALIALTVLGTAPLFAQPVWAQGGLERMVAFCGAYAVWTLAGLKFFPQWLPRLTFCGAVIYATSIAGPAAMLSVLLFLASCQALGSTLTSGVPALMVGAGIWAFVIGIAVHLPVNYAGAYVAAMAIAVLWRWRSLPRSLPFGDPAAASLVLAILTIHLVAALKPEGGTDALALHLAVPASVAAHHRWDFDFRHTTWSLMPLTADWTYTAVYLPGGAAAAKLLNFSFLAATVALLYGLLRRSLSEAASLLFCALYASSPILLLVTGSLFVENFWTAVLLAGFVCVLRGDAWAATLLLGTGIASKYGAAFFALPAAGLLLLHMKRTQTLQRAPAVLALMVCFAAPPYVRAYWESGNPIFPFLNTVFRSPHFESKEAFADTRFVTPTTWRTPYDVTFHTSRFLESQDGGWSFAYLVFVPVALLLLGLDAALVIGLIYAFFSFKAQSNARYLAPALPLFIAAAGSAAASARRQSLRRYQAMWMTAAALIPLQLYFLPASGWLHKGFDRVVEDPAPVQTLVSYLNRVHPGEPVAFFENNHIAGLLGKAYTMSWHNNDFWQQTRFTDSARGCLNLMKARGLKWFIAPVDPARINQPALRQFILTYTRREFEHNGWQVARLEENWARTPVAVLAPGSHDDMDPRIEFEGLWHGDRQFPEPANGSITYSAVAGALFRARFRGSAVTYVYTKAANRGEAEVWIDGARRAVIDQYSAATEWQVKTAFAGLGEGEHTLEVRVAGRRNPKSSEIYVDLDALVVEAR